MSEFALAVVVVIAALLTFTTLAFVVGPLVDKFQGSMNEKINNGWDGTARFEKTMRFASSSGGYFFTILTFFSYVYVVWMFKVIIYKHLYTTGARNEF